MKMTKSAIKWTSILLLGFIILGIAFYPQPQQSPIKYVDRDSGMLKTEKVAGEKWLIWLYNNPIGEATLWMLVKRKLTSSFYGRMMDKPKSAEKIQPFVKEYDIDLGIAQKQDFNSFNNFFVRKLKKDARPIDTTENIVISPADGKIMAFADISNNDFLIKGYHFDVYSFLIDSSLAKRYIDGAMIVIRLAPNDYHRFHFPIGGMVKSTSQIDGDYYSVNPIALRETVEIFCLNKREFTILDNPLINDLIIAEVGATMVGSILQTFKGNQVEKGQEKGYFKFGGSTVVLIFQKDKIIIDEDLTENTSMGLETSIRMGERIARMID